jgi:Flp pilus assembly protein TadD
MPTADETYDEAIQLKEQGKVEEAIGKLRELLAQEPDYALAHSALAVFCSGLEQHDEAIEHARRVCELEADDPFSFVALSLLCQKAGLIAEAERALMAARQAQVQHRPD